MLQHRLGYAVSEETACRNNFFGGTQETIVAQFTFLGFMNGFVSAALVKFFTTLCVFTGTIQEALFGLTAK